MKKLFLVLITLIPYFSFGQNIDDLLNAETKVGRTYETAAFKTSRVINGHSVEQMSANHLDLRIEHRFGELNGGLYNLYGLDQASMHFSLEYGIKDWLMAGIGRTNINKTYDGFAKVKLFRQTSDNSIPVFLSYMGSTEMFTSHWTDPTRVNKFSSRLTFVNQLLIARKFNENLTLQLSPTLIHKNLTPTELDANDLFALGFSGRIKVSNHVSLSAEYFYDFRSNRSTINYHNAASVAVNIETGGHVFQLMFTNCLAMTEGGFIWGDSNGDWTNGGVHFGFNISRVFSFDKKRNY
ncbi:MAG TPA: DUF5777 family beta-barrel protein [Sunxiuqinia sp.]|nr:DUF5777 family beta-barrel protein [Sunxiuqinia sp.]